MNADSSYILWICSIGGTPAPIVQSLLHWTPDRGIFIPSRQTRHLVDAVLEAFKQISGWSLNPSQYAIKDVSDPEDLVAVVKTIRSLDHEVADWLKRGTDYRVVVDFTGATKCMTAALALVDRSRCQQWVKMRDPMIHPMGR